MRSTTRSRGSRGQVIPVWTLGVTAALALILFVINYANVMRWQIRAQNAADAAAEAAVTPVANGLNEISLTLYTESIAENRIRYLNQAILNNLQGVGCSVKANCDSDYTDLVAALKNAINVHDDTITVINTLGQNVNDRYDDSSNGGFETITGYTYSDGRQDAACKSWGTSCTNYTDTSFSYTPLDIDAVPYANVGFGTPNTAEVASCKSVSFLYPKMLALNTGSSFRAVGVGAFTLAPLVQTVQPGIATNSATGKNVIWQPNESYTTADVNAYYEVDYSGLTDLVYFYVPTPTTPYQTFNPSTASCS